MQKKNQSETEKIAIASVGADIGGMATPIGTSAESDYVTDIIIKSDSAPGAFFVNSTWAEGKIPDEYAGVKLEWMKNAFSSTDQISNPGDERVVVFLDDKESKEGVDITSLLDDAKIVGYASDVFRGTIKNTVDKTGTKTNSVRKANLKNKGSFVVNGVRVEGEEISGNPIAVSGFATVTINNSENPVNVNGGDLSASVTRKATYADDELASAKETISLKRSAKGKLTVVNSTVEQIGSIEPEKYDVVGDSEIGSSMSDKLSMTGKDFVRMALPNDGSLSVIAAGGLENTGYGKAGEVVGALGAAVAAKTKNMTAFAEVSGTNSKFFDVLLGGTRNRSLSIDVVCANQGNKARSSIKMTGEIKATSKLDMVDSCFNGAVGFSKVEVSGGTVGRIAGGSDKIVQTFKSTDDKAGLGLENPTPEQQEMIGYILEGDYISSCVEKNIDHNVTEDSTESLKTGGSLVLKDGALAEEEISGFSKVELAGSTAAGDFNAMSTTESSKRTSVCKSNKYKETRVEKESYKSTGTLKAVDAFLDNDFEGFKNVDITFDSQVAVEESNFRISSKDESRVDTRDKQQTFDVTGEETIDRSESRKENESGSITAKVKISNNTDAELNVSNIDGKDVVLKGNISSRSIEAGSYKTYSENVESRSNVTGADFEKDVEKESFKANGKLTYDGTGTLGGGGDGEIEGFSKVVLKGANLNISFESYNTTFTEEFAEETKVGKDGVTYNVTESDSGLESYQSAGALTLDGCVFVGTYQRSADGFKTLTITGLHNKSDYGMEATVCNMSTRSSKKTTESYTRGEDESRIYNSVSENISNSMDMSAVGSAKIKDSELDGIYGYAKVELAGSTVGFVSGGFDVSLDNVSGKETTSTKVATDKNGGVTSTLNEDIRYKHTGSLKMEGGAVNGISNFSNVTLNGVVVGEDGVNNTYNDRRTLSETCSWASVSAYKNDAQPVETKGTEVESYKATGKLTATDSEIKGNITGFANVDIKGSDANIMRLGSVEAGQRTIETEYGPSAFSSVETHASLGTLKLKYAFLDSIFGFKTVSLDGTIVQENVIGGELVLDDNGKIQSIKNVKNVGTLTIGSSQEKGGSRLCVSQVQGTVMGFDTLNLNGKGVYIGSVGGEYMKAEAGVSKINVKGVATIGTLKADEVTGLTKVNISGKGAVLTLNNLVTDGKKIQVTVGAGAMMKTNVYNTKAESGKDIEKSKIAGEMCINWKLDESVKLGDTVKLTGKLTTSNVEAYQAYASAGSPIKDKVYFIGEGDGFFSAYMGETLENADNNAKKAMELTLDQDDTLFVSGWLNNNSTADGFNCIVDDVDYYKYQGKAFAAIEFDSVYGSKSGIDVHFSTDGKTFDIDWQTLGEEKKQEYLASDGYFEVKLKDASSGPSIYTISNVIK
ncbi:MAG: hypothetical protein MJ025_02740 [Victivallaceae bacterium]|nr:hypothetical protein [Victivallaceae bacterium]